MDPTEPDFRGLDADRPVPASLRARLEAALLDDVSLLDGLDAPRPLPLSTRVALERALVRQPRWSRWQPVLAAAAVVLVLAGSLTAVRLVSNGKSSTSNLASGRAPTTVEPGVVVPAPEEPPPTAATAPAGLPSSATGAAGPRPTPTGTTATTAGCPQGCAAAGAAGAAGPMAAAATVGPPHFVRSVQPASGSLRGGTTVTVAGYGFTGASGVRFGSSSATFTVVSDTEIRAVTPPVLRTGTVVVSVVFPDGTTSAAGSDDHFTYTAP